MRITIKTIANRFSNPGNAGIALIAGSAGFLFAGQYEPAIVVLVLALACIAFFHKPKDKR